MTDVPSPGPGTLFRSEVVSARGETWLGKVSIGLPPSGRLLVIAAAVVLMLGALLLVLGTFHRREVVTGSMVAIDGYSAIASPFEGVIEETFVAEGNLVKAGAPLFRISRRTQDASGADLEHSIAAQLAENRRRFEDDIHKQDLLASSQQLQYEKDIANLKLQLQRLDAQLIVRRQQAGIAHEMLTMLERLSNTQMVSRLELVQQKHRVLEASVDLEQLEERRLSVDRELGEVRRKLQSLPLEIATSTSRIRREIADIDAELARQHFEREHVVLAPRAGRLVNILPDTVRYVSAGQTIAAVLAPDAKLAAELWIPSRAIGRVDSESTVFLRFDAYPFQTFGSYAAKIRDVTASAFSPDEATRIRGETISEPVFRAIAEPASLAIRSSRGDRGTLRPGMTFKADVLVERVPLYRWLIGASTTSEPQPPALGPQ